MLLQAQFVDVQVAIECPNARLGEFLSRYLNTASHQIPIAARIATTIGRSGDEYLLASGRYEPSPEVTAAAAWGAVDEQLQALLGGWLQVSALCIDGPHKRILVLGEGRPLLTLLGLHALVAGLEVASAAGVCLKDGVSVPYPLALELLDGELARFRAATGVSLAGREWHDEMGARATRFTPEDFGRAWVMAPRAVDEILVLKWNEGGWSGFGKRYPEGALEHILGSAHLPQAAELSSRLRLVAAAKALAGAAPARDLHLGRAGDAPPLFAAALAGYSGA